MFTPELSWQVNEPCKGSDNSFHRNRKDPFVDPSTILYFEIGSAALLRSFYSSSLAALLLAYHEVTQHYISREAQTAGSTMSWYRSFVASYQRSAGRRNDDDGICGDAISTVGIPGTDIDRGPVVPVVASSSIISQAPSAARAIEDGLHIGSSDASSLGDGKPAAYDPLSSAQHSETLSSIQELSVDVKGGRTIPEHQSDTQSRMAYQERYYSDFPMAVKSVERLKLPLFEMKEIYRSWYAILLRRLSDHPDTTLAIIVTEYNGRLVALGVLQSPKVWTNKSSMRFMSVFRPRLGP